MEAAPTDIDESARTFHTLAETPPAAAGQVQKAMLDQFAPIPAGCFGRPLCQR
jgi:hypothetical protein